MTVKYKTIVADPPWPIKWNGGPAFRVNGRGERHANLKFKKSLDYQTMPVKTISELNVPSLTESDCVLWLWTPDRFAFEGTACMVALAWQFKPIRFLVWEKAGMALGNCPRPSHELCLVCSKGRSLFSRKDVRSVQYWKIPYENGARKHSAKPDGFFDLVQSCCPGPYLELFARQQRLGWDSWGNECLNHVTL